MQESSNLFNTTSVKLSSQLRAEGYVPDLSIFPSQTNRLAAVSDSVIKKDSYHPVKNISNTIISLQYKKDEFLTFKVCNIEQGKLVWSGSEAIGLQCRIGGKTYTFNGEHLNLMSNGERCDLFNHLGIDGRKLFQK